MAQVFLIMRRTDVPEEVMQVTDLWPNTSQRNLIYDPLGQTGYVNNIPLVNIGGSVDAGPPVTATANLTGLAAYLIGNIDTGVGAGGAPFTGAEATTAAQAIALRAQNGLTIQIADVNSILAGIIAGTSLTAGGSTGVLSELLSVMAGNQYMIEAGSALSNGGGAFAGRVGSFVPGTYRPIYDVDYFLISNAEGNISRYKQSSFTYKGVTGAALTVYSATGAIL
jgi:hypothetical protein